VGLKTIERGIARDEFEQIKICKPIGDDAEASPSV
jgi:hypothetical protein